MDQRVVLGRAAGAAKRAAKQAARDAGTAPLPKPGARRRARGGGSPSDGIGDTGEAESGDPRSETQPPDGHEATE